VFLGDLFDGGREWATSASQSPESQYWGYGEEFWHREHERFSGIFLRDWSGGMSQPQIIASLPGNHDLGFGTGIQEPVRARFTAFFGESNRIDIIGNHTFVSLDSVSLSAKDQETTEDTSAIWRPSEDFLDSAETNIAAAVDRHLNLTDVAKPKKYMHTAVELSDPTYNVHPKTIHTSAHTSFPIILLTHVPLYRPAGTPCGALRERHPPTQPPLGETNPVDPDERNAISVFAGYQYQNVLSRTISSSISERLGGAIEYAFSGDDHDYCELVHKTYPNKGAGIREITVKSMSWAMGVRKPGFLMVSMFNPIDASGNRLLWAEDSLQGGKNFETQPTLQTHLCLLPDQLSIFIRYVVGFAVTVLLLLVRSVMVVVFPSSFATRANSSNLPLLPTAASSGRSRRGSRSVSHADDKATAFAHTRRRHSSVGEFNAPFRDITLSNTTGRPPPEEVSGIPSALSLSSRNGSAMQLREKNAPSDYRYGNGALSKDEEHLLFYSKQYEEQDRGTRSQRARMRRKKEQGPFVQFLVEWALSLWSVARVVLPWYLCLQWR